MIRQLSGASMVAQVRTVRPVALVSDNFDEEHPRVADPGDEGESDRGEEPGEAPPDSATRLTPAIAIGRMLSTARPGRPGTASTRSRLIETETKTSPAMTAAAPAVAIPNSAHASGSYAAFTRLVGSFLEPESRTR